MKGRVLIGILVIIICITSSCIKKGEDFQNETVNAYIENMDHELERIKEKEGDNILRVYDLKDGTYSVVSKVMGYEEMIYINVTLASKNIKDIDIIYENESKDYGHYIVEPWFLERFQISGYDKLMLTKYHKEQENEVVAVTGASISSQAVMDAVNKTLEVIGG